MKNGNKDLQIIVGSTENNLHLTLWWLVPEMSLIGYWQWVPRADYILFFWSEKSLKSSENLMKFRTNGPLRYLPRVGLECKPSNLKDYYYRKQQSGKTTEYLTWTFRICFDCYRRYCMNQMISFKDKVPDPIESKGFLFDLTNSAYQSLVAVYRELFFVAQGVMS